MKPQNGSDYAQNYDFIVKWIAETLRGETLEALGLKTGRIEKVFGFEPAEIKVTSGRVDVMAREESGALYHIEEQRNLRKTDMYRFAAYHFLGAKQWGAKITDVILASGEVYAGEKKITTASGNYSPIVIDFSKKDGKSRLEEIRLSIQDGTFRNWTELVFLPLYGPETGKERSAFAENVLRFETGLYHAQKIPVKLLAATLIMSNKLIEKDRLKELWEDIKMLDILEIAKEKGIEEGIKEGLKKGIEEGMKEGIKEGIEEGIKEGKNLGIIENAREMLAEALIERFKLIPQHISDKIQKIQSRDALKGLFRQAFRCNDLQEFEDLLKQV